MFVDVFILRRSLPSNKRAGTQARIAPMAIRLPLTAHDPSCCPFRQPQAEAFVRGLWEVIDPLWLQMFSEPELQVLISGSNKTLDVEDLKRHTR